MKYRFKGLAFMIFVVFLASCSDSKSPNSQYSHLRYDANSYLHITAFNTCSEVGDRIKYNYIRGLKDRLNRQRNQLVSILNQGDYQEVLDDAASDSAENSEGGSSSPKEVTGTNNQVEGVQESDIYKTDGNFVYVLSGGTVRVVNSWPAETMREIASLELGGRGIEMFLSENKRLFVAYFPQTDANEKRAGADIAWYPYYWDQMVKIKTFDVTNPANPSLLDERAIEGTYITMRRIGDEIKIIQNQWLHFTSDEYIDIWEDGGFITLFEFDKKASELLEAKEAELATVTLNDILGQYEGSTEPIHQESFDCRKIYSSDAIDEFGYTKISSYNLSSTELNQSLLLSPSRVIYSSHESLYTAINSYRVWEDSNAYESRSFIHRFSLGNTDINYLGSGMVKGHLKDQFSIDEKDGILRLALTEQSMPLSEYNGWDWGQRQTFNRIVTLEQQNDALTILGQSEALAEGEVIYSARFSGSRGFVVTFRQVDPLFTIDLEDPANPKVIGELKVPGFSTYIHMVGENHLLTVGLESWVPKISLFDVSDFANPVELDTYLFNGEEWGYSESVFDHKAFTYYANRGLLAIPYGYYDNNGDYDNWQDRYKSQLRLFKIDLAQGISLEGDLPMNDLFNEQDPGWAYWWYGANVRRSFFADDYVYSISTFGIKSYQLDDLANEISRVAFY